MPRAVSAKPRPAQAAKSAASSTQKSPRRRSTYRELLLKKLAELCKGEEGRLVSNNTLQTALDWDDKQYDSVKQQLINEDAIITGRGRGGSVALANSSGPEPLSVFISYSHIDEKHKIEIVKHLKPFERINIISNWHDRKIEAGQDWKGEISTNLKKADIVLLLVSIDFINSEYCYDIEMEEALDRHSKEEAVVIPIIVRACIWTKSPFAKLQAVPKDAQAITTFDDLDTAYAEVAEAVGKVASRIFEQRR